MRLFLGSFAHIDNLEKIERDFKKLIEGRWVQGDTIHLTYLFLGEVEDPQPIIFKLRSISYKKKDIPIKGLGFFGHPPKILYAKIDDEEIDKIHKRVLQKLGVIEKKPFIPHITLCRIKRVRGFDHFVWKLRTYNEKSLGHMRLRLALIKSELTPKGAHYEVIATF